MTDVEVAALFLQMFEGLDVVAEQMDLLIWVFGEQEAILPVRSFAETEQEKRGTGLLRAAPHSRIC